MKTIIITENFLKLFLFCTAFVGVFTFAIEFKRPKVFKTELKGNLLKLTKKLPSSFPYRFNNLIVWEKAFKFKEEVKNTSFISSLLNSLVSAAGNRNNKSDKIDLLKKKMENKKEELVKKYPNYKKLNFKDFGQSDQESINQIKHIGHTIEFNRQLRVKIDKTIVDIARNLYEFFEKAGYSVDYWHGFFEDF